MDTDSSKTTNAPAITHGLRWLVHVLIPAHWHYSLFTNQLLKRSLEVYTEGEVSKATLWRIEQKVCCSTGGPRSPQKLSNSIDDSVRVWVQKKVMRENYRDLPKGNCPRQKELQEHYVMHPAFETAYCYDPQAHIRDIWRVLTTCVKIELLQHWISLRVWELHFFFFFFFVNHRKEKLIRLLR